MSNGTCWHSIRFPRCGSDLATSGEAAKRHRHNLSDERTEYLIRDRLSFMRFLGLGVRGGGIVGHGAAALGRCVAA
jgi:hypothetical protein